MITAFRLAGFFAAHAIWCVSDGSTLIPIFAFTNQDGERQMERLAFDDLPAAVDAGRGRLASNPMDADDAVFLYDARIPLDNRKLDAIVIEIRAYFSPDSQAIVAIPYTPGAGGKFRVHKPKLLDWKNCEDFDLQAAFGSFFEGVAEHEKGAQIWNAALDESV